MSLPPTGGSEPPNGGSSAPDDDSPGSAAAQPGPGQSEAGQPGLTQSGPAQGGQAAAQPESGQPVPPGHAQPGQFGGYPGQYGQPSAGQPGQQPGQFGGYPGQYGPTSPGPAQYGQANYQYAQPGTGGGPMPAGGGGPPSSGNRSLITVIAILAVLILGAGVTIFLLSNGEDGDGDSGLGPAPLVDTSGVPTPDVPTDVPTVDVPTIDVPTVEVPTDFPTDEFPTDDLPTDFPTDDLPTDLPTDLPSLPALPTGGGPGDQAFVKVARAFVKAAAAGDCAGARALASDSFNEVNENASFCAGATRAAMRDDDLDKSEVTAYGAYVASVEFDRGQTLIAMVVEEGNTPLVTSVLAYDF